MRRLQRSRKRMALPWQPEIHRISRVAVCVWSIPGSRLLSLLPEVCMRRLSFLLMLCLIVPAFPQTRHPFTFEDMMKLKRVGEPVPSPDGKWVLFSAVDVDLAANKKTSHIWIMPLKGGTAAMESGHSPIQTERGLVADQE